VIAQTFDHIPITPSLTCWVKWARSAPAAIVLFGLLFAADIAVAAPLDTNVTVRIRAHDAKFVGSHVGEVNIVIEDADTGAWLASGRIAGGTGDTQRLMQTPATRNMPLADADSAAYTATLKLERPTRIRIRATGPLAQPDAVQELSVTAWVVPGRNIDGDGIVLNLPGLIVTPKPQLAVNGRLPLVADVTLMCGCPITKDGLWDSDDYEVHAQVATGGGPTSDVALKFTGETNRFAGDLAVTRAGRYDVTVWAYNAKTGNTGAASYSVDVP
jgi:hypothetical protein